jgi:hypothetical protein
MSKSDEFGDIDDLIAGSRPIDRTGRSAKRRGAASAPGARSNGQAPGVRAATPRPVPGAPRLVRLSDVRPQAIEWLWPDRFALGKLSLIAGNPGLGKSFLTLDVAARISTGAAWPDDPDGVTRDPASVVLLSAEDAVEDTIAPRLVTAGADMRRIVALEAVETRGDDGEPPERHFDLTRDLAALAAAIESVEGCRLVVIDPLTAYLGRTDAHANADVRGVLAPLAKLAERYRVAVIGVSHFNKAAGGAAIYRTMGSMAFVAAVRSAWGVVADPAERERRLLLPIKSNIAADPGGLAYGIATGSDGSARVAWEPGRVDISADVALGGAGHAGPTELDDAKRWLTDLLADGGLPAREVEAAARDAGYTTATLRRAKAALQVDSRKADFGGGWIWVLPVDAEGAHTRERERLRGEDAPNPGSAAGQPKALNAEGERLREDERLGDAPEGDMRT